ncbi:thiol:disulfide interchange protein DsbA/DsbL [Reinekea thalattae]|uniref:Thiol:disulfide interchange protein n=1 Tax=Reinekea thalattae TaxID=2593301 RepID=A0A5C8ZC32_9GAMM|nr:thiol:disulfide interchange protein DsbA/DsbL [Reinekea thalattae]TXR54731.1 thiol:disulfide interchange protein DsbA/DsbL [Reinekea thalattae]
MFQRYLLISLLVTFASAVFAAENTQYKEGQHYVTLQTPLKTSYRGDEIGEVMEFFSYNCIHCANLEPAVSRYLAEKPDNIKFTPIPVVFNEHQKPEARAYYVLEISKLGKDAHQAIFNYIHKERKRLRTDDQFAAFFESKFGISKEEYMKRAYSFAVNAKLNTAIILTRDSNISGTPSLVANGLYRIDSAAVGGNELALYAAQSLVQSEASE